MYILSPANVYRANTLCIRGSYILCKVQNILPGYKTSVLQSSLRHARCPTPAECILLGDSFSFLERFGVSAGEILHDNTSHISIIVRDSPSGCV